MTALEFDNKLISGYLELLENLNPVSKLELISKLSNSVKQDFKPKKRIMKKSFGAFESEKTAEEMIEDLRKNRIFTRKIESF